MTNVINFEQKLLDRNKRLNKKFDHTWDKMARIKELDWDNQKNKIKCLTAIGQNLHKQKEAMYKMYKTISYVESHKPN